MNEERKRLDGQKDEEGKLEASGALPGRTCLGDNAGGLQRRWSVNCEGKHLVLKSLDRLREMAEGGSS
ncbi:MAG: hypothetical protein ABSC19_18880 [Syntrophorhabdales bacterium]|jgi:hypothetical protein